MHAVGEFLGRVVAQRTTRHVSAAEVQDVEDERAWQPPSEYLVHWLDDDRRSVVFPGPDAVVTHGRPHTTGTPPIGRS